MEARREQAAVGALVLIAAAILVYTLFAIGGVFRARGSVYHASFEFIGGLQAGQTVRFGGMAVGEIRAVRVDPERPTRIEVEFAVDPTTPVRRDSVARITSLGPLGDNYLELTTGSRDAPLLPPGSEVQAEPYVSLNDVVANLDALTPRVERLLDELTATASEARDLLNETNRNNVAGSLADLRRILEDGRPKIAETLSNLDRATAALTPVLENLEKTVEGTDRTVSTVRAVVDENRPDLRKTVESMRATMERADRVMTRVDSILSSNEGNLWETLDDLRVTMENLKEFSDEIKRRPASLIRGGALPDRKPGERPEGK